MNEEELAFHQAGSSVREATLSQMFGKPCFKADGKAFICFFEGEMVFKLNGSAHEGALQLSGAKLFDPSSKNRPMKEWVQVPFEHHEEWKALAQHAYHYVCDAAL
jgi:hypothetical protein